MLVLIFQWHTGVYKETFLNNAKYLRFHRQRVESIYKKWQTLVIIREISDSNLETGRYGSRSGVFRIIRKS